LMERSASSYSSKSQTHVMCLCNVEVPLMPSWTKENPGRNFYGCGLYRARNNVYYWFCFVVNSHEKMIIVALMKKVDELKVREKGLQTKM
ncbi:hypothetical protein glysoja_036247, partial [Glycine soja]